MPFRTVQKAVSTARAGDTIYVRGGTYNLSDTVELNKNGSAGSPYKIWAYPGETPILDGSNIGYILEVNGSYWYLKGIVIEKAGEKGVQVEGAHNTFEEMTFRLCEEGGIKVDTGASYNTCLNCDAYLNYDSSGHGGNADGFMYKHGCGEGNALIGCRAWTNSDDGYDLMEAGGGVIVQDCWAWNNGINIWGDSSFEGNGVGFKLGDGNACHDIKNCLAWGNGTSGFNVQGNTSGFTLYNCTAWDNSKANYLFDENTPHHLRNNISFDGRVVMDPGIDDSNNSWNGGFLVTAEDFLSLDDSDMDAARGSDGSLPKSDFLRLAPGSDLIDAGIDVGLEYNGRAPDLGAFESAGVSADLDHDWDVDWDDLAIFVQEWVNRCRIGEWCGGRDINESGRVDFDDFAILAGNWLKEYNTP